MPPGGRSNASARWANPVGTPSLSEWRGRWEDGDIALPTARIGLQGGMATVIEFFFGEALADVWKWRKNGKTLIRTENLVRQGGMSLRRDAFRNKANDAATGLQDLITNHLLTGAHKGTNRDTSRTKSLSKCLPLLP